ncbi:hypothetical protein [Gordonia sihwensis]|uniref:hypothetical protein n=1 Tax=Gordonia sihwensis TaxID=173559 RepID=UPI003D983E5B
MNDAELVVQRFVLDYGVFTGSAKSPVGEYTSVNVTTDDVPLLMEDYSDGLAVSASELVGHYFARRQDGVVRATRYRTLEDLSQVQRSVHTEFQEWAQQNTPSQEE